MKVRPIKIVILSMLILACLGSHALAGRLDLNLGRYFDSLCNTGDSTADSTCAQGHFENLMSELGQIIGPVMLSPAETLGLNGFAFSFEGTVAPISNKDDYWDAAQVQPSSSLFIPRLHLRKGFPFSIELGTQLAYIPESDMYVLGAELKWAINEGFYFIPDLALRVCVNHMIGPRDFELSTGSWDVSISKAFGIGGMMALTPYIGYNMLFVHASSHLIVTLGDTPGDDPGLEVFNAVKWNETYFQRVFVGLRVTSYIFQVVLEGVITSNGVNLFNFKLGFEY